MAKPSKDAGTIQVLLNRLNEERLPLALRLKSTVDRGECLTDYDLSYLKDVLHDADTARRLADKYPEYQELVARLTRLYGEIMDKAAANQQKIKEKQP